MVGIYGLSKDKQHKFKQILNVASGSILEKA